MDSVKSKPLLDCVEICRYATVFPMLHVTLGIVNRLLKWILDYDDLIVEEAPVGLTNARAAQMKAEHIYLEKKKRDNGLGILEWRYPGKHVNSTRSSSRTINC